MRQTPERRQKPNLAERTAEHWRPPLFTPAVTARQQFVAALRRFFDLQAGSIWNDMTEHLPFASGTVLDVGCGAQPYRALLPPTVAYCGIDTEEAEANFGYTIPDTLYFSGDSWPIADASIHLVFATETLEHVLDPARFLAEAFRCLRPSGRLLLTVPFAARWHFIPHDYWRYTPSSLKYLLAHAGFENIVITARGNSLTVACYKVMGLMLPLLFPQGRSAGVATLWATRILGVSLIPLMIVLAVIANVSLRSGGGDDFIGLTAWADKPAPSPN